ncbi:MAG: DUF1045 domain-containing protein [Phyllobacterium sp.]
MRYAVYFTPVQHDPLQRLAARWLGRNAFSNKETERPAINGMTIADIVPWTHDPQRYGFHATMKAPFHLAEGAEESEMLRALMHFTSRIDGVTIPRLKVAALGRFFALVPDAPVPALNQLANDVVVALDRFRAPPTETEIARRKPETMKPVHLRNLEQWGYPYVFEEFRFHMTLTGPVPEKDHARMHDVLNELFSPLLQSPVEIDNLALFVEAEPGSPFEVHSLHPLGGVTRKAAI